jgi:NAD(P)-dependent dehydrogenase (short-subunit alcohol dehydrogenase family)
MDELRFDGRVVVVTGGGNGIGRAHAMLLAAKGAQVVVADLGCGTDGRGASRGPAEDVVREINAQGGAAIANAASVVDPEGAASIVSSALDAFGRLDVVVNNAGIFEPGRFEDLSEEQFRRTTDVHYLGTVMVTKAAWPHFVDSGYGRIVNTTSDSVLGLPLASSYAAAKAAIFGLTRTLAMEGAAHGIRANCIAPQALTRMSRIFGQMLSMPPEVVEEAGALMPPAMNAPVAAFLAHDSCPLNGEILHVTPGRVSRLTIIETQGLTKDSITAEDIAANLDTIMDTTDAEVAAGTVMDTTPAGS